MERERMLRKLQDAAYGYAIRQDTDMECLDGLLWDVVLVYQHELFHTSSGLPFSYVVKRNKNGTYGGELLISRKEDSKTLTKSSLFLAFHKILSQWCELQLNKKMNFIQDASQININSSKYSDTYPLTEKNRKAQLPYYKGPKAIGQIFGISYIYSLFYVYGLISVPKQVAMRM